MPYSLPTFNLTCNVYSWVAVPGPLVAIRETPDCNLQFSRRVNFAGVQDYAEAEGFSGAMWLLLPPLTDVRPGVCYGLGIPQADLVEVPAGSGRIYYVSTVDDVGKGFANEFRCAGISPTAAYGLWPSPIP